MFGATVGSTAQVTSTIQLWLHFSRYIVQKKRAEKKKKNNARAFLFGLNSILQHAQDHLFKKKKN